LKLKKSGFYLLLAEEYCFYVNNAGLIREAATTTTKAAYRTSQI
jgi:hypothetical protein